MVIWRRSDRHHGRAGRHAELLASPPGVRPFAMLIRWARRRRTLECIVLRWLLLQLGVAVDVTALRPGAVHRRHLVKPALRWRLTECPVADRRYLLSCSTASLGLPDTSS
jgi:hypothetical protein